MKAINEWKDIFELYLLNNPSDDGSHDLSHFQRVWQVAESLSTPDEDKLVILAASYFHDIVNYPKNDPRRSQSSRDAGIEAKEILTTMNFPHEKLQDVEHAIAAHSFSANITPETQEAKIVQDADRMESLGAIGLARVFYVAGRMGSQIFNSQDPFAKNREYNDMKYAIDHFYTKLFKLPETMKTVAGKTEANKRADILRRFLSDLESEL